MHVHIDTCIFNVKNFIKDQFFKNTFTVIHEPEPNRKKTGLEKEEPICIFMYILFSLFVLRLPFYISQMLPDLTV